MVMAVEIGEKHQILHTCVDRDDWIHHARSESERKCKYRGLVHVCWYRWSCLSSIFVLSFRGNPLEQVFLEAHVFKLVKPLRITNCTWREIRTPGYLVSLMSTHKGRGLFEIRCCQEDGCFTGAGRRCAVLCQRPQVKATSGSPFWSHKRRRGVHGAILKLTTFWSQFNTVLPLNFSRWAGKGKTNLAARALIFEKPKFCADDLRCTRVLTWGLVRDVPRKATARDCWPHGQTTCSAWFLREEKKSNTIGKDSWYVDTCLVLLHIECEWALYSSHSTLNRLPNVPKLSVPQKTCYLNWPKFAECLFQTLS